MRNKEYIERNGQTLKCELYYSLGGMNYFQGKNEARGYYYSVTPVKVSESSGFRTEQYTAFSGIKKLVLETKRKSDKGFQSAMKIVEETNLKETLIDYVLGKENS